MSELSKNARSEIIDALRQRYRGALKSEKRKMLDEFADVSGYHRKHLIRLMSQERSDSPPPHRLGARVYDAAVRDALVILWEAADRICGKRLKAALPLFIKSMEAHGHLRLADGVRDRLLAVSAATIDRLLVTVRQKAGSRRRTKRVRRLSREIPIKTRQDWKDPLPGYLEIDFVVHGGSSMSGEYLHSLVATDVCSGWTEAVPLLAREQSLAVEGLKQIRRQMPVPMLGIDSDNDGAFINDTLAGYCEKEAIVFTRSRVHHKNDQSWIEQKNGAVIRRFVGHGRFSGLVAGQALAQLLQSVRLYVNYFQPSLKLRERTREGSRIKKFYHPPATPCERLLSHPLVSAADKEKLRAQLPELDPVELLHRIRQGQAALAALSNQDGGSSLKTPDIEQFLAQLPTLWKEGEVRATHRNCKDVERHWRTREDPFGEAWSELLLWLQSDPDATAKSLMKRLQVAYPDLYPDNLLRTLQRRIKEWRRAMARNLILPGVPERNDIEPVHFAPPPAGASLRRATRTSVAPLPEGESLSNPPN